MLKDIKRELLLNPQAIVNILEAYDFYNPRIHNNREIRCGLSEGHNPTAIRIKLINNDNLFVSDYTRGISYDLINYIINVKNSEFIEVCRTIKAELGISDFYELNTKHSVFGGFYDKIKKRTDDLYVKTYPESLLSQYKPAYNQRFLQDNIAYCTQDKFEIGYDVESQRITLPIRNEYGDLIGVKGRANWNVSDDEPKYLYIVPCAMSRTLYGYCQNYNHFKDDIYVFEAEKSVLQCDTYGINSCVALGSNSISSKQCKLLMELAPKRVVFMLDKGLDTDITKRNAKILSAYTRMFDTQIWWWDWTKSSIPDKASPSDYGADTLKNIIDNEIVEVIL